MACGKGKDPASDRVMGAAGAEVYFSRAAKYCIVAYYVLGTL